MYVQWTLPAALRRAVASSAADSRAAALPPVPNRWLVVRSHDIGGSEKTDAWVIDSDYADKNVRGTSPYALHRDGRLEPIRIGRCKERAQWTKKSNGEGNLRKRIPPLTAVGPGLPMFAAYQPYNTNVFSFHDPLTPEIREKDTTLHYFVVGWRAEEHLDVLRWNDGPDGGLQDRKRTPTDESTDEMTVARAGTLGWNPPPGARFCPRTVYGGAVHSVAWSASRDHRAETMPSSDDFGIAVGPTAIDAFAAAFTSPRVPHRDRLTPDEAHALTALAYGQLSAADEPDGAFTTAQRQFATSFLPHAGGHCWRVLHGGVEPENARACESNLNALQQRADDIRRRLGAKQWELYAIWRGSAEGDDVVPPDCTELLRKQLDATAQGTVAAEVTSLKSDLKSQLAKLPLDKHGNPGNAASRAFLSRERWPDGWRLVREDLPPFHRTLDPVVLLSLPQHLLPLSAAESGPLDCWTTTDLPDVTLDTTWELSGSEPLDEAIAREIAGLRNAAHNIGKHPGVLPWHHPWHPLYLEWEVHFRPVDFEGVGAGAGTTTSAEADTHTERQGWTFNGNHYTYDGVSLKKHKEITLRGRQYVDPRPARIFRDQMAQRLKRPLNAETKAAVEHFMEETDKWRVLAQPLGGLTEQLTRRIPGFTPTAPAPVRELTGKAIATVPDFGPAEADHSLFRQTRAGQFYFTRLVVVDHFGRAVHLITKGEGGNYKQVPVDVSERLDYSPRRKARKPDRFIRLQPRLPQPARLSFTLMDSTRDVPAHASHGNPVCGWLLPNRLDRTVLTYTATGYPLRSYGPRGGKLPVPPHPVTGTSGKRPSSPSAFTVFVASAEQHLDELWEVLDASLPKITTGGQAGHPHLGLIGRPLAVVRARLTLELDGPPLFDPAWKTLLPADRPAGPPPYTTYPWAVRLGEPDRLTDGLIGYTLSRDGSGDLYCVHGAPGRWTKPMNSNSSIPYPTVQADGKTSVTLTLLMDAHTAVHATTGILPVASLRLPEPWLRPLESLPAYFELGPLLAPWSEPPRHKPVPRPTPEPPAVLPAHSGPGQDWQWYEHALGTWHEVQPADTHASPDAPAAAVHKGLMTITPVPAATPQAD
ncbi:hypothetical protein [Streptomyces sp. NPDC023327]|uniref:hypothetical protein n=1 Tax=Streptomyces sp. NPDC023327 TaxID=3157088 RepID=UPI0033C85D94